MNCNRCERYKSCNNIRIKGVGSVNSRIMIVADYPHIEADLAGEAFTGRIPDVLKDTLKKVGIDPKEVYMTYLVKCGISELTKHEIAQCLPYLHYEIVKLKPKYIITLGNDTLNAVAKKSGIIKYRGVEIERQFSFKDESHSCIVIPTVSPAAVLRMPKYKKMFRADLEKLHNLINENYKQPEHHIIYCMDNDLLNQAYKECMIAVENKLPIGFDLETEGLDYWRPEKRILTMSLSVGSYSFSIPLGHPQSPYRKSWVKVLKLFKFILENGRLIAQNGKFDAKWLKAKVDIDCNIFFDTMLASYILDENTPHNLGYLSQVYLKVPSYKQMVDQANLICEPVKLVMKYNSLDTHYTLRLYEPLVKELKENPRLAVIFKRLLMGASEMYTRSELLGIWVDKTMLIDRYNDCMNNLEAVQTKIDAYITTEFVNKYLTKRYKTKPDKISKFNMNSPKQKAALLFEPPPIGLGLPITITTATGNPSTSEEALIYLKDRANHPVIDLITEYQGWEQHRKMFLSPWQEKLDSNNRMHPNFKLLTVTGRTSCEDPNVQQVPRDPFIRGILGAPKGKILVEADYSQIELRVIAYISGDSTMKRIYQTGGDIHTMTASQSTGKPVEEITKEERKTAKAVNFGYAYGAWWTTFQRVAKMRYGLDLSDDECKHNRERFFELYSGLPNWHSRYKQMATMLGKVISPNGRERRLPDIYSVDDTQCQAAEREAINSPVQGFASDITLSSAIDIYNKYIKGTPIGNEIEIVITVHDAIFFEIDEDKLTKWIPIIKKEMEDKNRLKEWYGVDFTLPIIADIAVGKHWGYSKELNKEDLDDLTKLDLTQLR